MSYLRLKTSRQPRQQIKESSVSVDKVEFDLYVATYYQSKVKLCENANIHFDLTLQQVRQMLKAKKCYLTGVALTTPLTRPGKTECATDVTIDRMDNRLGYVKGNVHAVCRAANNAKSLLENPCATVGIKEMGKIISKMRKSGLGS